ncbi:MAG: tetraacyldisaccharide 4'-kinase, partial [Kiritimatiellae bacterium]|nr:tetraacyldisaccharide 4'-kinase [Kiritimatiellia bacterium]
MAVNQLERIEQYFLGVINERRKTRSATAWRLVLVTLSRLFGAIVQLRLYLYAHRLFRHHTLGCQVVSVGNLTVGGTGKTPIVEIFSRSLQQSGRKVAILSRGYKKKKPPLMIRLRNRFRHGLGKSRPPLVVSDGKRLRLGSTLSGDEPYMLAANLPNVAVLVDKDRVKSGKYAIQELGCDTLVLDDGFQHLRLKHWVDIVLVDSTNPFGNGHV